jgi:hypothetical protein
MRNIFKESYLLLCDFFFSFTPHDFFFFHLLRASIITSQVCYEERIALDTKFNLGVYHRLHATSHQSWVASHPHLPHHDSVLNPSACFPRG